MIENTSAQDIKIEKKRPIWMVRLVFGIVAVSLVATSTWLLASISSEQSVDRERLLFAEVEQGEFSRDVVAAGRIVAANAPTVFSTEAGLVDLRVKPGEQVELGQIIAEIISPDLSALRNEAKAMLSILEQDVQRLELQINQNSLLMEKAIDIARVEVEAADREYRRAAVLFESNLISEFDFEQREDELEKANLHYHHAVEDSEVYNRVAAFELSAARGEIERQIIALNELDRRRESLLIRSPVDGMVGNQLVEDRARITGGAPIVSVVDLTQYQVELSLPDVYSDDLAIGMKVDVSIANTRYEAELVRISPEIQSNQLVAFARFNTEQVASLRQNQRVSARVLLSYKPETIRLRRGAFLDSNSGSTVYVIKGGIAERRDIVIGDRGSRYVEILEGLDAGEQVIISSYSTFSDADVIQLR